MNSAYELFGQYAFRKVINGRRGPVNKSFFEMWSYTLNNLSDTEIDCLLSKKSLVQDSFFNLFDDYRFMNNIKAADKEELTIIIGKSKAEILLNYFKNKEQNPL